MEGRENLILVVVLLMGGFLMMFLFLFFLLFLMGGFSPSIIPSEGKIGVIEVQGVIEDSTQITVDLRKFAQDSSIRAIVVRVDSPGGAVGPSQEIYAEILKTRSIKPVIVSLGSVAASGGYYVACAGQRIFSNPGTLTGSIGVILESAYMAELVKLTKIEPVVYKSGEHKDMLSPFRRTTEDESKLIQGMIDDVHDQFVSDVSQARNLPIEKVKPIADGRLLTGRQALASGLVDELGNFHSAVAFAAQEGGIQEEPTLVYPQRETLNRIEQLLNGAVERFFSALARRTGAGAALGEESPQIR